MELTIFTDASVKDSTASYAFMILSETAHIATRAGVYDKPLDICSAEYRCIEQAIQFMNNLDLPEDTHITVNCDNVTALAWAENIESPYKISYEHIKGHQSSHNPNKVLDSLAKGVLACNDTLQ